MRCAILALAAGLLMIAGSAANACDSCAIHTSQNQGNTCKTCKSRRTPRTIVAGGRSLAQRAGSSVLGQCRSCRLGIGCGGRGCRAGLQNLLQGQNHCGHCGTQGHHCGLCCNQGIHCGHHAQGMPIGPGGPYAGPSGPMTPTYGYPYYTIRGPRDFLMDNPPTIGR